MKEDTKAWATDLAVTVGKIQIRFSLKIFTMMILFASNLFREVA